MSLLPERPASSIEAILRSRNVAACFALATALAVAGLLIVYAMYPAQVTPAVESNLQIAWSAAYAFSIIASVWFVFMRRRGMRGAELRASSPGAKWVRRALGIGVLCIVVEYLAFFLVGQFAQFDVEDYSHGVTARTNVLRIATLLLYIGLIGPFAEELIWRGVLFRWIRQRLAFWPAAILSSIPFGLVHIYTEAVINAFFAGLVFSWLFERTRSLVTSTVAHQTWNCISIALTYALALLGVDGGAGGA